MPGLTGVTIETEGWHYINVLTNTSARQELQRAMPRTAKDLDLPAREAPRETRPLQAWPP